MRRITAAQLSVLALTSLAAISCSRAINPLLIQDAHVAARVKTMLVNDAILGVRPIEVSVLSGVARLSGSVASEAEAERAAELARAVDGVRGVHNELSIRPIGLDASTVSDGRPPRLPPVPAADADLSDDAGRTLLALGVTLRQSHPASDALGRAVTLGPLIRVGSGRGLGLSLGFGWFTADLSAGTAPLGRLRLRPVMAGLGYTMGTDRTSLQVSMVAGVAFNSLSGRRESAGPVWALDVRDSLAWRPGASLWIELGPRAAFNVSAGYLVTRARLSLLDTGREVTRSIRGDALIVNTGLVYKLF